MQYLDIQVCGQELTMNFTIEFNDSFSELRGGNNLFFQGFGLLFYKEM